MDTFDSDGQPEYEIRQFNFNNVPETNEFKDFRLKAFKTPDGWEYVSTWRDIYRSFCLYVFNHKPKHIKALKDLDDTFLGRNVIFASDSKYLYDAFRIKYNFFVEQRLSSSGIVDIITKLIYYCRLPASQFIVRYETPVSEEALAEDEPELDSTLEAPNISHYFSLDNPPVLKNSGAKPCSIKIGSNISSWREILVEIVKYIDLYYPDKLDELLRIYGPKGKRFILAKSKNSFFKSSYTKEPQKVRNGLFVKGDLTSDDIIQIAISFLVFCDIDPSQVLIEYRPKGDQTTLDNTFSIDVNNISDVEPASELEEPEEEISELDDNAPEEDELEEDGEDKEFDNDLVNNDVDNSVNFKDDKEWDFSNDEDDFVDIGMEFTDDGLPVLSPAHQKLIDAIEEKFPKGIDIDNEDSIRTLELASGIPCNKYTIEDLRMILAYNKADNVFYVPLRLADESTVKSMAAFIDQNVNQYNAVSLSVIREKFQDQFDCECDDEELLEFIEWYVFREMDRVVAIDYNDIIGDGVCLPRSITTDEFCENLYGQIESYLEKTDSPVPMSQLRQLYPSLNETIISYALSDDRFGSSIQEETKDEQLFYSVRLDSQLNDKAADLVESEQTPQTAPPPENSYFNLDNSIPNLTGAKPLSISYGEKKLEIRSWTDVILQTAIYIDQNEPDAFNSLIEQYGQSNSRPHLFSRTKFINLTCKPVNSDYYVNTNFCATTAVKTAQQFLQPCKLPLSEVRLEYLPAGAEGKSRSSSGSIQVGADYTSFTKPVNKSMFKTCIVVPTQCHDAFLGHLTNVPKAGTSVPVTMWLNGSTYSVSVQNPDFSVCGAPPQVRFTWNASSPIVQALKKECPISYKLFQSSDPVPSGTEPENVTVSLGVKPDEFIMKINDSSTDAQPERQQELFSRTEEETQFLCENILQRAKEAFPENSCHQRRINVLTQQFKEDFSTDEDIIDFIVRNHIGVYSQSWIYFLTDEVADRLLDIISQLHKEGQILAYYGLLHDRKFESFDSVKIFKNEEAIAGLFIALRERYGHGVVPFYPMPQRLALEIDAATIKDALLHYFENNSALTYEQIKDQFPYIPEKLVQDELKADDDFIALENCKYALTDTIELDDKHCQKLVAKIESEIQKHGWISCNDIDVTPFLEDYPEMTARAILDYFCKKILPKQYVRKDKGNVISDRSKPVNSADILTDFCISNSSITYSQLINFAEELSASQQTALSVAFDKMVRIDKDKFIAPDLIQFDVEKIDNALESFVSSNDFIPLQDVNSFSFFPKCGSFSWNWFLLESFCRKYSKIFGFMVAVPNNKNVGAIVRKTAQFDDYTNLMAVAVNNNEIELSAEAIGGFLLGGKYIAVNNKTAIQKVLDKARVLREIGD